MLLESMRHAVEFYLHAPMNLYFRINVHIAHISNQFGLIPWCLSSFFMYLTGTW